ncbi:MAG: tetratricopeptide repeat protein [Candidatus Peregrinibacteria bacterium]
MKGLWGYIFFFFVSIGIFLLGISRIFPHLWKMNDTQSITPVDMIEPTNVPAYTVEVIAPNENNVTATEKKQRATAFFTQGSYSNAIKDLQEILSVSPDDQDSWKMLMESHIARRDFTEAEKIASEYLKKFPADTDMQMRRGEILILKGDFSAAQTAFGALAPENAARIFYEGILASYFGDHEKAQEKFKSLSKTSFGEKANQLLSAYNEYALYPDSNENHRRALLSQRYNALGFYNLTIEMLRPTIEARPDYRDAWILEGYAYLSLGKFHTAQNALEKAVSLDPTHKESAYFLGLTLAELGLNDQAVIQFKNALANGFTPPKEVEKHLAETLFRAQQYDESLQYFEKILDADGTTVDDFVRPIWIAIESLKSPDKGIEFGKRAVIKFPESAMAYNLLGWTLISKGDFTNAEKALEKAKERDATMPAIWLNYGKLRKGQGKKEEALQMFQKAHEMDKFGSIGSLAAEEYNALVKNNS